MMVVNKATIHNSVDVVVRLLRDDGVFPNHPALPLLLIRQVFSAGEDSLGEKMLSRFQSNSWTNGWKNGVYDFHHYHSISHEVLGVISGKADLHFGGPKGVEMTVQAGDAIVLPAGTAHKCNRANRDFCVVGAYADGRDWDVMRGEPGERPEALERIKAVPLPKLDPVFGEYGPLIDHWHQTSE